MIEQTVECSVFIREYVGHGFSRKFQIFFASNCISHIAKSGRLLDVMSKEERKAKIAKFNECFDSLKNKFDGEVGFQVAVELFKTSDAIKSLGVQTSRVTIRARFLIIAFRNKDRTWRLETGRHANCAAPTLFTLDADRPHTQNLRMVHRHHAERMHHVLASRIRWIRKEHRRKYSCRSLLEAKSRRCFHLLRPKRGFSERSQHVRAHSGALAWEIQ